LAVEDYDRKQVIKDYPETLGIVGISICGEALAYGYQVGNSLIQVSLNQDGSWKAERITLRPQTEALINQSSDQSAARDHYDEHDSPAEVVSIMKFGGVCEHDDGFLCTLRLEAIKKLLKEKAATRKVTCSNCGFDFTVPKNYGGYLYCPACHASAEAM
jgi:predicted Zn-ribbon and HTH transcriptional regulator